MRPTFDARDADILAARLTLLNAVPGPRVGDYVEFADGATRRISYNWGDGLQTSDGGSFYLGEGFASFSGSLYGCVPPESLTRTDETRPGRVWFFHHGYSGAGMGVDSEPLFRVYRCSLPAPH